MFALGWSSKYGNEFLRLEKWLQDLKDESRAAALSLLKDALGGPPPPLSLLSKSSTCPGN